MGVHHYGAKLTFEEGADLDNHMSSDRSDHIEMKLRARQRIKLVLARQLVAIIFSLF
jgi:hypothetical protein